MGVSPLLIVKPHAFLPQPKVGVKEIQPKYATQKIREKLKILKITPSEKISSTLHWLKLWGIEKTYSFSAPSSQLKTKSVLLSRIGY
jgi:hypothetical protein